MSESTPSVAGDTHVLHRQALHLPVRTVEAERSLHRNMSLVADSLERKAEMIADPEVPLLDAYEEQRERIARSYEASLERFVGEDYESIAREYRTGERDDGIAGMAAYLMEAQWRLQQMYTVTETTFFPIILRYPESVTINVRFTSGHVRNRGVRYESPSHNADDLAEYADAYRDDSFVSRRRAAEEIAQSADVIRDEFPDPDAVPYEERKTGGIVSAAGRRGSEFASALERVDPDPDRFDAPPETPQLVPSGDVARRTEAEWLPEDTLVI